MISGPPLRLVLIRHGRKADIAAADPDVPLDPAGFAAVEALASALRDVNPGLILSSRWLHASQTAKRLAASLGAPCIEVTGLTPFTAKDSFTPRAICREAHASGLPLGGVRAVALVGHHARVSNLASRLCGGLEIRELEYLEGVKISASSLRALLRDQAVLDGFVKAT
ncbi:MAG: histidine phosphatase family protein [Acidobacteriota bacterium]